MTFLLSWSICSTRDSGTGETFLGGGELFLACGGGERPRLAPPTGLLRRGAGLGLRELPLRGEEDEEKDLERERDRDLDLELESEPEYEREREEEPDGDAGRPRAGLAIGVDASFSAESTESEIP